MNGLSDTDPESERVQIELLRAAGPSRRASLALGLSRTVIALSRRALRAAHPECLSPRSRLSGGLHYGRELAEGIRAHGGCSPGRDRSRPGATALGPVVAPSKPEASPLRGGLSGELDSRDASFHSRRRPRGRPSTRACRRFAASLAAAYYLDEGRIRHAVAHRRSFNLIHLESMFKVDIFVSKGRPFDQSALARAEPHPLGPDRATRPVLVASPEDTILAKLEWYRAGGETSERQWSDILGVLRTKHATLERGISRSRLTASACATCSTGPSGKPPRLRSHWAGSAQLSNQRPVAPAGRRTNEASEYRFYS